MADTLRLHLHDSGVQQLLAAPEHEALRVTVVGDEECPSPPCGVVFEGSNDNNTWVEFRRVADDTYNLEFDSPWQYLRVKGFGGGSTGITATVIIEYLESAGASTAVEEPTGSRDAFGRYRVSVPKALFDSKLLYDKNILFWDEDLVGTASSAHSTAGASVVMTVSAASDSATRQTRQRFNYQPGRSQLGMFTGVFGVPVAGVTRQIGLFDDDNGMFFQQDDDGFHFVIRKGGSDTKYTQGEWSGDNLNGTGDSGHNLAPEDTAIYWLDYEWLGVGLVRFGIVRAGQYILCGEIEHDQVGLSSVYTSVPNLPVRYAISTTGNAATLVHICSAVLSEGGESDNVVPRSVSTNGVHVDANVADTVYALCGIRLKSTHISARVFPVSASVLSETNDKFEWFVLLNPNVAGTFTYSDEPQSAVQAARGATANTVSNGYRLFGGWGSTSAPNTGTVDGRIALGSAIDGTPDEIVLCVRPLSTNADIQGTLNFSEVV